ncbi:MAG: adenylyl-sulfate kinase [Planctomycetes bacterium]|nr:adenylyl-sulfate kinase [Planctomycetota bacterium]
MQNDNIKKKKNNNVIWHHATVTRARREAQNGHKSFILWFTGLSGAGKSTLAHAVEEELYRMGCNTFVFDGDNVRHGLNRDLGFSQEDRKENIRRIGEMCKLFIEAGVIALTAFISPYKKNRNTVRQMVNDQDFIEIYCDCSLDICEKRDVKGSYAKARKGEISDFTGISAPYEAPENPEIIVSTGRDTLDQCTNKVIKYLIDKNLLSLVRS